MDLCDDLHRVIFRLLDVSSMYSWLFVSTQALAQLQIYWNHGGHHPSDSDVTVSMDAVQRGYIHLLEWHMALSNRMTMTKSHMNQAAKYGQLVMVEWLHHSQGCIWDETTCMMAAGGGHFKLLQSLHDYGCPWNRNALLYAALSGHFDIIKYLTECGCPCDETVDCAAARGGFLEILKYLHDHNLGRRYPWNPWSCAYIAVAGGHVTILQYLRTKGCNWHYWKSIHGVGSGHLEVVKYLHQHGCQWDSSSCFIAAENGHLDILQYLHQHGCPLDARTRLHASNKGHLNV